jgi:hypothetical protein
MQDPQVDDIVTYTTTGGRHRTVRVFGLAHEGDDMVFDGVVIDDTGEKGTTVWGWFSQIVSIERGRLFV